MATKNLYKSFVKGNAKRRPPNDPVPRRKPKTGATGGSQSWDQNPTPDERMPEYKKGRPKKTTEGYEPWQYNTDAWQPPSRRGRKRYRKITSQGPTTKV
jgi:hypothetical protein